MVYRHIIFCFVIALSSECHGQANYLLTSQSGDIHLEVKVADSVYLAIRSGNIEIQSQSAIALLTRSSKLGIQCKVRNIKRRSVRETIVNPVPFKRKEIPDHFNELTVAFKENFSIIFRAYDMRTETVDQSKRIKIALAPGGGFVAKLIKDNGEKL